MSSKYYGIVYSDENNYLAHHGIKGQRWGVRRYQNYDGKKIKNAKGYEKALNKTDKARAYNMRLLKDADTKYRKAANSNPNNPLYNHNLNTVSKKREDIWKAVKKGEDQLSSLRERANKSGYDVSSKLVLRRTNSGKDTVAKLALAAFTPYGLGYFGSYVYSQKHGFERGFSRRETGEDYRVTRRIPNK